MATKGAGVRRMLKATSLYRTLRARGRQIVNNVLLDDPCSAAKFYPIEPNSGSYIIAEESVLEPAAELPVPSQELWLGYAESVNEYLAIGRKNVETMNRILAESDRALKPASRVLDFGCGSGIMIRWLRDTTKSGDVWGVDVNGRHILWCQEKLSPPFKFATTTTFPHLPFEDSYFDLVYAGSVFTHIADLIEFWLLELRRILRPCGLLYVTVHDESSIEQLRLSSHRNAIGLWKTIQEFERRTQVLESNFGVFAIHRRPGEGSSGQAQVFYKRDHLLRHWGGYLNILSMTERAYGYQTAVLMQKP